MSNFDGSFVSFRAELTQKPLPTGQPGRFATEVEEEKRIFSVFCV
jgi:hypothetical protein